jgi:hypothetical protein
MSDELPVVESVEIEYVIPANQPGGPSMRHVWAGLQDAGNTHDHLTVIQEIDETNGATYGALPIPWDWITEALYLPDGVPVERPPALK